MRYFLVIAKRRMQAASIQNPGFIPSVSIKSLWVRSRKGATECALKILKIFKKKLNLTERENTRKKVEKKRFLVALAVHVVIPYGTTQNTSNLGNNREYFPGTNTELLSTSKIPWIFTWLLK